MTDLTHTAPTDIRRGGRLALFLEFWSYFRENRGAVAGLAIFIVVCLLAIFADAIAPHLPNEQYRDAFLRPPIWQTGPIHGSSWVPTISAATFSRVSFTAPAIRFSSASSS